MYLLAQTEQMDETPLTPAVAGMAAAGRCRDFGRDRCSPGADAINHISLEMRWSLLAVQYGARLHLLGYEDETAGAERMRAP